MMHFIMILDAILCVVMAGFTGWNWMLAFNGKTTIEFWSVYEKDRKRLDLSFSSARDNIYRVFGTYKIIRVLSPSLRNVPFTGLEWSFWFKDSGYDANGYEFPNNNNNKEDDEMGGENGETEQTGAEVSDEEVEMVLI